MPMQIGGLLLKKLLIISIFTVDTDYNRRRRTDKRQFLSLHVKNLIRQTEATDRYLGASYGDAIRFICLRRGLFRRPDTSQYQKGTSHKGKNLLRGQFRKWAGTTGLDFSVFPAIHFVYTFYGCRVHNRRR
jgi:hypothetical protein